ncbi:MAG: sulfate reduction electron transfer complex DsrMKJOP subunit DsrM [Bacteroidales bacterium]
MNWFLAVVVPSAAAVTFLCGIAWRVLRWANTPVPFRIPLTAGQQASLPFLKPNRLDNPSTTFGASVRVAFEVLFFRSLLRNVALERQPGGRLAYLEALGLWAGALAFHYALLVVLLRHLRLVLEPVPAIVTRLVALDTAFEIGVPAVYASDVVLLAALGFLAGRRVASAPLRQLSLFSDYALPLLIGAVAVTGVLLRHVVRADVVAVKALALGLVTLTPPRTTSLPPLALLHIALASTLVALLPFTKLVHMAAMFLSPTRTLANTSRTKRHVNPWHTVAQPHTYAEWETHFRDKLLAAGLPVEESAADRVAAAGSGTDA